MTSAIAQPPQPSLRLDTLKDFDPFLVDPAMRWLRDHKVSELAVAVMSILSVAVTAMLSSALTNDGFWAGSYGRSTLRDIWSLFDRPDAGTVGTLTVPFLRDYPSMMCSFTIATAPPLVYSLFHALGRLHSSLAENDCLQLVPGNTKDALETSVSELNSRIARFASPSRCVIALLVGCTILGLVAAVGQRREGFFYLLNEAEQGHLNRALYNGWWARPYSAGFFAWCIAGGIGLYMVYIEAVVGLHYVAFVRRHRSTYRFKANRYNVDRYYGWAVLRRAFSFMLAGVATSTLSAFALYFFLAPELPLPAIVVILTVFLSVVIYVSVASSLILRSHVIRVREETCREIVRQLDALREANDVESLLRRQILADELGSFRSMPNFPIRTKWVFLAGFVTALGVAASIAQIVEVWGK